MPDHPLWSGDRESLAHIQEAKTLDVDWPAKLVSLMVGVRINLLNLVELSEIVRLNNLVDSLSFSPVDEVLKHQHDGSNFKLACATKPQ